MTVNSVEERILAAARYKLNMDEKVSFLVESRESGSGIGMNPISLIALETLQFNLNEY